MSTPAIICIFFFAAHCLRARAMTSLISLRVYRYRSTGFYDYDVENFLPNDIPISELSLSQPKHALYKVLQITVSPQSVRWITY